jgi:hypothetical protein
MGREKRYAGALLFPVCFPVQIFECHFLGGFSKIDTLKRRRRRRRNFNQP